ncbi:gamma-glutamyl kinase [Pseudooceanicola sp.]|uniref:gamma-glutamyl kinase n=1 Tax=Pseudooceanicola sp. TaxID=1914328 RepID=UPI0026191B9A|nr:gamma-glutamyl kinase [Pseudooceanicola sp.]MDF1856598.1 gamma-glutamyl kinase [Pseudooceanicola sp.]
MLVFSKARLVILSVPKTGTTAIEAALGPQADIWVQNPPELKHAPVYRYNRFFRPMLEKFVAPELEVIAVMREPVSWLGSWWRFRQRPFMEGKPNATHGVSFDDFVDGYCRGDRPGYADVGSQAKFLEAQPNGTRVTRLFRYEDQPALIAFLENALDTKLALGRENVSPEMPMDLSAKVAEKYRRKCAAEFDLYASIG